MMSDLMAPAGDPKLIAVLARMCERRGSLWTTQAVKLPYLVDLVALHVLGEPITRSRHKAWTFGVVTARAWGLIKKARGGQHFRVEGDPIADGYRLILTSPPEIVLSAQEYQIVDFVLDAYGSLQAEELGTLTKELNPEVVSWGGSVVVELTETAYESLPVWFGEDFHDAETASSRIAELNPDDLIGGREAEELLAAWGSP